MAKEWFETWFDTRYYHLLYKHRDENEARQFIEALLHFLKPHRSACFLDVACGKGRHAIQINAAGYDVTGIDLSANSIAIANESSNDDLRFEVHDIRNDMGVQKYDYALNLFTSFGYFEDKEQHIKSLRNIHRSLKPQGIFVFDYLNIDRVGLEQSSAEEAEIEGIHFRTRKTIMDNKIVKKIEVIENGQIRRFEERVMAFNKSELEQMLASAGFTVAQIFGDYNLSAFDANAARVIIIAKK